jgi:ethanolamine utilization protein EutJ
MSTERLVASRSRASSRWLLEQAAARLVAGQPLRGMTDPLRVGIDLGTASCVVVVLDQADRPVWVDAEPSGALRDGVVVDFAGAADTVRALRERAEQAVGRPLPAAATAYPPCIGEAESRACRYVCESAGFEQVALLDEVSAAQHTLELTDGVLVDVGGGSTGVGIFRDGRLQAVDDRPGGGHHLDLILAGALGIGLADAERRKREQPRECLPILVPGFQRIAESVRAMTDGAEDLDVHLAGGALMAAGADRVLASYLRRTVVSHPHALLITPLGIALAADRSVA